jgi:hypothetical protein
MRFNDQSASGNTRTPLARALAGVLLIGIIYAVTFGSAHSHGNVSSALDTNTAPSSTGQASSSSNVPLNRHDCLICLLHQQLFNSIVHEPVFIVKPSTQVAFVSAPAVIFYSSPIAYHPITQLTGRAPPLN